MFSVKTSVTQVDYSRMTKFDKIFILTESMNILKEKEIMRVIDKNKGKVQMFRKLVNPKMLLSCYFGKQITKKLCNIFKVPFLN